MKIERGAEFPIYSRLWSKFFENSYLGVECLQRLCEGEGWRDGGCDHSGALWEHQKKEEGRPPSIEIFPILWQHIITQQTYKICCQSILLKGSVNAYSYRIFYIRCINKYLVEQGILTWKFVPYGVCRSLNIQNPDVVLFQILKICNAELQMHWRSAQKLIVAGI